MSSATAETATPDTATPDTALPDSTDLRERLATSISETIAPAAAEVDRDGSFPRAGIDALARAGVLGATSATDVGGGGGGIAEVAEIVEQLAAACSSTSMVVLMHFSAAPVIEAHGPRELREAIAAGRHLTTLAFSEVGSRSHFWAPGSTATPDGAEDVRLDARKSWITSAGEADSYVWSSRPLAAGGPMTLWLVPSTADGLSEPGAFDGLGLRGNASRPITADGVVVPRSAMLGEDGAGLDIALGAVLPTFLVGSAAFSIGLMQALVDEAGAHLTRTRLDHLGKTLAEQPATRIAYAKLLTKVAEARAFLADTLAALATGRPDAMLRVLQVKAVAGEAAAEVADGVMRICGGAAFRKELGVERRFRDALAARVMAPTTDALRDFVGRAALGQPLLDEAVAV
jgi:alkylation response protein AidB-like acyl-CoA dehydrogenase